MNSVISQLSQKSAVIVVDAEDRMIGALTAEDLWGKREKRLLNNMGSHTHPFHLRAYIKDTSAEIRDVSGFVATLISVIVSMP